LIYPTEPTNMCQLVYTSVTPNEISTKDLSSLLEKSRKYNTECGITGVLLYKNNKFLQVLEGDKNNVMSLFENIKKDVRHTDITVISLDPTSTRVFNCWSMGLGIAVEDEDMLKDPMCFSLVTIIPFRIQTLFASSYLTNILIKFLDIPTN